MRIVESTFRDYYDSTAGSFQDEIFFKRNQRLISISKINTPNIPKLRSSMKSMGNVSVYVSEMVLGYCGEFIPVLQVIKATYAPGPNGLPLYQTLLNKETKYAFSIIEYEKVLKGLELENLFIDSTGRNRYMSSFYELFRKSAVEDFFNSKMQFAALNKYFHEYKTPIFLFQKEGRGDGNLLLVNPILKSIDFHSKKSAVLAYQDISRFLTNDLSALQNPMVEISNKDKIHKHGFNDLSFRKQKETK